jgi:hypothetical protein
MRPEGFYWIRIGPKWNIATWARGEWTMCGTYWADDDVAEVGPRIEPPAEVPELLP